MAVHCPGQVVFFAREPGFVHLAQQHRGGRAVFVRDHAIILADGEHEERLIDLHEVSFTREGHVAFQVENALAATAAAWCLKLPIETIRHGLRTFNGDAEEVPGRFNVLNAGEATVIVDYAHNPSAVEALVAGLDAFSHTRRTLVFSGCNRRDSDLLEMGEELGHAFDRVVLYADRGNNGRDDGELNAVLRRGLERGRRVREVIEVATESAAVEQTLRELHGDELLVIGVEAIEQSLAFVRQQLG